MKNISEVIKKNFKCKLCKNKYPITLDMLRTVYNVTGFGNKQFFRSFNCPCCGLIYVSQETTFGRRWVNETWEFFEAK